VKAAKNAFMKCVAVSSTQSPESLREADLVIDSFKDLSFTDVCSRLKESAK
jgi:beta-phosphoglucomutase-like phosphatase (HAD superfamily)